MKFSTVPDPRHYGILAIFWIFRLRFMTKNQYFWGIKLIRTGRAVAHESNEPLTMKNHPEISKLWPFQNLKFWPGPTFLSDFWKGHNFLNLKRKLLIIGSIDPLDGVLQAHRSIRVDHLINLKKNRKLRFFLPEFRFLAKKIVIFQNIFFWQVFVTNLLFIRKCGF